MSDSIEKRLRSLSEKVSLSDEAKNRIADACAAEKKRAKIVATPRRRASFKNVFAVAAVIALVAALTVALAVFGLNRGGDKPVVPADVTSDDATAPVTGDPTDTIDPTDTTDPRPDVTTNDFEGFTGIPLPGAPDDPSVTDEPATTDRDEINIPGVGGGGVEFDRFYVYGYSSVCFFDNLDGNAINFEGTFIKEREAELHERLQYYDQFFKNRDSCAYRNTMWYIVRDLGLEREDVENYYAMMSDDNDSKLTNSQIDALFIEDEYEARDAMRLAWTLFDGQNVYRIIDIEKMTKEEFKSHNFRREDIDRLIAYFESYADSLDYSGLPEDERDLAYQHCKEMADSYIRLLTDYGN